MSDGLRFETGTVAVTPRAEAALAESGQLLAEYLRRHAEGDWTDLDPPQRELNEEGIRQGFNVVSHFQLPRGGRLMLVTLGDRSCTMVHVAPGSEIAQARIRLAGSRAAQFAGARG